ncbi:hypothetical protein [Lactiplantibacillus plantarum]|uniref:hypothetical protein n=1 Tax=Lactiplantibacillus plantarum TaxID=1590 RepID=UPI0015D4A6E4|nr:hypothetical protein [Lactiplantibacillus plantarum]
MKYSEAEKRIKALSNKYDIDMEDGDFAVSYKDTIIAWVKNNERYLFYNDEDCFKKISFSKKLYMILAELAITPLYERVEEKKYKVKVFRKYLNVPVQNVLSPFLFDGSNTETVKTCFTLNEIEQLKQRDDIPLDWGKVRFEEAN